MSRGVSSDCQRHCRHRGELEMEQTVRKAWDEIGMKSVGRNHTRSPSRSVEFADLWDIVASDVKKSTEVDPITPECTTAFKKQNK
ncbi:hypothetical protein MKX08_003490 [Trichoderma sp. CBMAI-0020]|nr:hypothetical protein MKX08_003490 [Trichoderma sp. CBMAI-0020]